MRRCIKRIVLPILSVSALIFTLCSVGAIEGGEIGLVGGAIQAAAGLLLFRLFMEVDDE